MLEVIQGDCLNQLDSFSEKSIDIIVTSPPYNIKKNYLTYKDDLPYPEYLAWMNQVFEKLKRVLKDDGSFFLNIGSTCKKPYIRLDVCHEARQHFILQNDITWVKSISIHDTSLVNEWKSYGHFKPINSDRFLNQQHESIFHFTKTGEVKLSRLAIGVPYQDKSNIDRWKHDEKGGKPDKRCRGNVWHIPYKTVNSEKFHSAGFPAELPENCIRLHAGDSLTESVAVLDPFLGAGSTLMACKKLGVTGFGIELDEVYCQLAKENIS